ncbi:MAG: hypothetical protein O3A95_01625 [Planctomycetota bacterium]|nr:hypothetical protein [Planctomycetota bacterium]MDA1112985.1 hypothetical protein [Planctomycetota bacterium]
MKCREASIQISLHVGDDLPASEVPELESHLETCPLCEAEYESYASARDALFLLKDEFSGSTSLWEGIEGQLEASGTPVHAISNGRAWYRRPMFSSAMAAALLIGITVPMWMSNADGVNSVDLAEHAALTEVNLNLGNPADSIAIQDPTEFESPVVEMVSDQETLDFLERNLGKVFIQDADSPISVSYSDSNRGSH